MVNDSETRTEKGISLSRGPALILGTVLLAAGLYFLYRQHSFPKFSNFPDGSAPVNGKVLFNIFGANGWTGMLTAVGGGLLLFGAAQHLLAKTMSLIVGVALGAAAIIAAVSGNVLGMAAANVWTEVAWGASAAILLFNVIVPRRRRTVVVEDTAAVPAEAGRRPIGTRRGEAGAAAAGAGAVAERHHETGRDERLATEEDRTVAHDPAADRTVAHDPTADRTVRHDGAGRDDGAAAAPADEQTAVRPRDDAAVGDEDRLRAGRER